MSEQGMRDVCAQLGQPSHTQTLHRSCRSRSLQSDHLTPSIHHFSAHSACCDEDKLSQEELRFLETDSNSHKFPVAQQFRSMTIQPNASMEMNEMTPRLGKEGVHILECEFKRNPKPTTMARRQFAEDIGVDLSRINNWFQNRRAKCKQKNKQEAYEAGQAQEALGQYSAPVSPDFLYANTAIHEPTAQLDFPSGPIFPIGLYNPQYSDPSTASIESLHRTLAAAEAASKHNEYQDVIRLDSENSDYPHFPSPDDDIIHLDSLQCPQPSAFPRNLYDGASIELRPRPHQYHISTLLSAYPSSSKVEVSTPKAGAAIPSKPLARKTPGNSSLSTPVVMFNDVCESDEPSTSPPAPLNLFKSPPPRIDIASRRKKVQHKPAALIADTLRSSRPFMEPRKVSHAEGFRRLIDTPASSPMRVIISAGGNRNVLPDRVYKSGVESSQRSPINLGPWGDFPNPFLEQNYPTRTIRQPPSPTEGSSLNSSLAPPTPIFPREREMTLIKRKPSRSATPLHDKNINFNFNAETSHFTTMEDGQNQWHFDIPAEPLCTPMGLNMSQPSNLRPVKLAKAFAFSHTTTEDFLGECKSRRNSTDSASEDRGEQPQPIETVDEMKIKVEIDCHREVSHQDEDVSERDSCSSDKAELLSSSYVKACNGSQKSTINRHENEQDDFILPILEPMRQALVERIMDEFYLIFNQNWAARITKCPGGCSPTSGDGKDCGIPLDKVSLPTSQQKRQRSYDEDSADENDNKKPRRQRVGLRLPSELNNPARFACPFRKHDPQKYSMYGHRVCALTGWDTIARVKEHLYRNHKAAPYCQRCWVVFKTEELLNSHATVPAALICEASPGHPPEGITPKQVADLRSKAKPYSKQNEADRWKEIFRLLFPNESVPSPYWEPVQEYVPASPNSQVLVHYDDYMHRELPRLFRSRVEEIVSQEIQPVEASLLANLEGLIRECQYQLSSGYRETHLTGQQSRVLPTQRIETLVEPVNLTNTAEHSPMVAAETHQQPSSDFFDAVLQPPPPQEQDFVLNFSASDAELFGPNQHTPSGNLSDSGYASVSHCSCKEPCRCFTSMIGFENRDIDISGPSFVNLTQGMDMDAQGVQWQNWLENRD